MAENYKIIKIEEVDFFKLIPLMQDAFGLNVNIEYFKWKFLENPAGSFVGYVAEDITTNEIAAYYGVIPEKYILNKKEILFYQSCDTMTHSKHRRKGLFKKLALKCYEDLNKENKLNIYGFGGATSTPGFLKMGWKIHSAFLTISIPSFLCNYRSNKKNVIISEKLNEHLITFIHTQSDKIKTFHKLLDKDYLHWKFNNPLFTYFFIYIKNKDNIESLLIYKIEKNKLIIIDIFGNKNIPPLIQFIKNKVIELKLKGVLFYIDKKYRYELLKFGFIFNPLPIGPLSDKIPFITLTDKSINNWVPTMIEHDAI